MRFVKTVIGSAVAFAWLFVTSAAFAVTGPLLNQGQGWMALGSLSFGLMALGVACAIGDKFING